MMSTSVLNHASESGFFLQFTWPDNNYASEANSNCACVLESVVLSQVLVEIQFFFCIIRRI